MKKYIKTVCFLLIISIFLSLCSCGKKEKPTSSGQPRKEEVIEWMIFDPFSKFSGKWKNYSILRDISSAAGITPEIKLVSSDFNSVLSKILMSGSYPDIMTFLIDDVNLLKAYANLPHIVFGKESSLYQSIDEDIRSFHLQENGTLRYIPGGFCTDTNQPLIANEGIYIHTEAYQKHGGKISSFDELNTFIDRYLDSQGIPEITDIMLMDDKGFSTLEHLFGVSPTSIKDFKSDDIATSVYAPVISRLKVFCDVGVNGNTIEYAPDRTPLIFIGSASAISSRHAESGKLLYTSLDIYGSDKGFVSTYSKYGSFATLITKNENSEKSEKLISYMISTDTSRIMMYGEENKNWVIDESNNHITLISDTVERMRKNDKSLLYEKGISVFPYVSSCYAVYPDPSLKNNKVRDILSDRLSVMSDPTSDIGKIYYQKSRALKELYLFTLAHES